MKKNIFSVMLFTVMLFFYSNCILAQDKYEMTVSADGSGDFKTIQQAIESCKSFPDRRITIFVKNGIYHEKVVVPACNPNLSIIGESAEKTIITYDDYFGKINRGRNSTFFTYTLLVEADDFIAENLTIENSAGPVGQAVALHVEGDRCVFRNCRILGNQDTLYTGGVNSCLYFAGCYIEGTTDFIFGASTALFDSCTIHSKANSFITAASTIKGKSFGYVFIECNLTAAAGLQKIYLGRPWRDFARVVFINCNLGPQIVAEGWANWQGTSRDKTAFFAEYGNSGPGADLSKRVPWSHQLTKKEALKYTLKNILAPEKNSDIKPEQWTSGSDVNLKK
jgi:pectinesterase